MEQKPKLTAAELAKIKTIKQATVKAGSYVVKALLLLLLPCLGYGQAQNYQIKVTSSGIELYNPGTFVTEKLVNVAYIGMQKKLPQANSLYTISSSSRTINFYYQNVLTVSVNGSTAAAPVSDVALLDSLKSVSIIASGGGSGGSTAGDASAANQTIGNNLSTTIRDSSIVVPNIVRVTRDRVKTTNDSLAALNNISREIRDKATTTNGLTDVQLRATPVPVIDQKTIDTLNVSANVQRVTSARIKDGNDSLNALNNISRQIRDKVNNDQKSIDTIAAGNDVARQIRDLSVSQASDNLTAVDLVNYR